MTFSIRILSIRIFDYILYNTLFLRELYVHATLRIMRIHENLMKIYPRENKVIIHSIVYAYNILVTYFIKNDCNLLISAP